MAIAFFLGMMTGWFVLGLWWLVAAHSPNIHLVGDEARQLRVVDVRPTGERVHRNLSIRVDVAGKKRLYIGSVTVWHLVTDAGLVRAPGSIERKLSDVWSTYKYEHPHWGR